MAIRPRACALFAALLVAGGCATTPDRDEGLHTIRVGDRSNTLVVMLPGIRDEAEQFLVAGFVGAATEPFDVLAVAPAIADYFTGTFVEQLRTEVIEPAQARGYDAIWLVGVSIGGYGSLLYADAFPADIRGVVLLAPYLGGRRLQREIAAAGSLDAWATAARPTTFGAAWLALNRLTQRRDATLLLGFGGDDKLAATYAPLLAALPQSRVYTVDGGHEWATWAPLWREIKPTIDAAARSQ